MIQYCYYVIDYKEDRKMKVIKKTYDFNTLILRIIPSDEAMKKVKVSIYGANMNESKYYYNCHEGFNVVIQNDEPYSKLVKIMIQHQNDICYYNRFRIPPYQKHQTYNAMMNQEIELSNSWDINNDIYLNDMEINNEALAKQALQLLK